MDNITKQNKSHWLPSQLSIIVALLSLISTYSQVPLMSTEYPYPGLRRIFTYITTSPLVEQSVFTYTYPYAHMNVPYVMTSLTGLQWTGQLGFEFSTPLALMKNTGFTFSVTNYLQTNPTNNYINSFIFLHAVYDPQVFEVTNAFFEFIETSSAVVPQTINITDHEFNLYAMLTAFQDYIDPLAHTNTVTDVEVIYTYFAGPIVIGGQGNHNLSYLVSGTNGYMIKRLKYQYYNVTLIDPYKMDAAYVQSFSPINGDSANQMAIGYNELNIADNHFYGIDSLWGFNSSSGNMANVLVYALSASNANLSAFTVVWKYKKCPPGYPYLHVYSLLCAAQCESISFLLPQRAGVNNYFRCVACTTPCVSCTNTDTNCTACVTNSSLTLINAKSNIYGCLCVPGYFGVPPSCKACNASMPFCLLCSNASVCQKCDKSLLYNSTTGKCQCVDGSTLMNKTISYYDANNVLVYSIKPMCINNVKVVESCNNLAIDLPFGINTGLIAFGQTCQCFNALFYINNICIHL